MAQLHSISSANVVSVPIHASVKQGRLPGGNLCWSSKSDGCQVGAESSSLHGNRIVHQRLIFNSVAGNQAIKVVASQNEKVEHMSGGGLRGKLNKVVLAYSGGLDTSVIVPWLRENYGCNVVCFTADVGQGILELDGLEAKAKASGASQLVVRDLKEEFVKEYIFPCLRAGAIYERKYLLGTSMARPVIAKSMMNSGPCNLTLAGNPVHTVGVENGLQWIPDGFRNQDRGVRYPCVPTPGRYDEHRSRPAKPL